MATYGYRPLQRVAKNLTTLWCHNTVSGTTSPDHAQYFLAKIIEGDSVARPNGEGAARSATGPPEVSHTWAQIVVSGC